jgi:L-iditol 2-dehydrogenase
LRAICTSPSGPLLSQRPAPEPAPGWARLRVCLAGVCRTDLQAARGELPVAEGRVLGHELVGALDDPALIAALGARRCAVRPRLGDGRFLGLDLDGAFAEQLCVPTSALVPVPDEMSLQRAAFVEPMAAALAVLAAPWPADGRAALRGEGRIAELCRRVLAWAGRPLLSPAEAAEGGLSLLVITDAAPILDLSCVAVGGRVLLKGRPARPVPLELRAVVEREITLQGVNYGDFDLAVRLLHSGAVPVDDLFAPPLPLADFAAAFSGAEDRKAFLSMGV